MLPGEVVDCCNAIAAACGCAGPWGLALPARAGPRAGSNGGEVAGEAPLEEEACPPAAAAAAADCRALCLRASPLQLQDLGVQQNAITFTNVTMESDKYICVRETGAQNQLVRAR